MRLAEARLPVWIALAFSLSACGGGGGGDGGDPPPVNRPPVASFLAAPSTGSEPLTVQFDATASSDPD